MTLLPVCKLRRAAGVMTTGWPTLLVKQAWRCLVSARLHVRMHSVCRQLQLTSGFVQGTYIANNVFSNMARDAWQLPITTGTHPARCPLLGVAAPSRLASCIDQHRLSHAETAPKPALPHSCLPVVAQSACVDGSTSSIALTCNAESAATGLTSHMWQGRSRRHPL